MQLRFSLVEFCVVLINTINFMREVINNPPV